MTDTDPMSARVADIISRLDAAYESRQRNDARQAEDRAEIKGRLAKIDDKLVGLATLRQRVEINTARIDTLEAIATDYKATKNKVLGGATLLGIVGGGVAWLLNKIWP